MILKLTREIKTALLVISAILLFIWGYSFLKGNDLFTKNKKIYVQYDNVEGLTKSTPVTLSGLIIGNVSDIVIDYNTGKVMVELLIKTDFPISKSSTAVIYEPGFIAGKQVAIHPNLEDKSVIENKDQLKGSVESGLTATMAKKLEPLQDKIEKLLVNVDNLVTGLNNVLDAKGQADLKGALAEFHKTMEQFHKVSVNANAILSENKAELNGVVTNFNKISNDFAQISDSLNKADLGKTAKDLQKTLANVDKLMADLQAGKGSMGMLLKDEALYKNLTKTSKELELLLEDVRLNPTRYVNVSMFGKKNKPYVAPEENTK